MAQHWAVAVEVREKCRCLNKLDTKLTFIQSSQVMRSGKLKRRWLGNRDWRVYNRSVAIQSIQLKIIPQDGTPGHDEVMQENAKWHEHIMHSYITNGFRNSAHSGLLKLPIWTFSKTLLTSTAAPKRPPLKSCLTQVSTFVTRMLCFYVRSIRYLAFCKSLAISIILAPSKKYYKRYKQQGNMTY